MLISRQQDVITESVVPKINVPRKKWSNVSVIAVRARKYANMTRKNNLVGKANVCGIGEEITKQKMLEDHLCRDMIIDQTMSFY